MPFENPKIVIKNPAINNSIYGLWVVPKNRIIFLLNNSLLPLLPGVRQLLSKKFDFLGLPTRSYRPDFILEHLYKGHLCLSGTNLSNSLLALKNFYFTKMSKYVQREVG